jgi:hypothetical protein
MMFDSSADLDFICKKIIDYPTKNGCSNIDLYNIFRLITSKKSNLCKHAASLAIDDEENQLINLPELKSLVLRINPFYKFNDEKKNAFYAAYFLLANKILRRINEILKNRNNPDKYLVFDIQAQKHMTFHDLDTGASTNAAVFTDSKSAEASILKWLDIYKFLKIKKTLELHVLNMDDQIIDKKIYTSYAEDCLLDEDQEDLL